MSKFSLNRGRILNLCLLIIFLAACYIIWSMYLETKDKVLNNIDVINGSTMTTPKFKFAIGGEGSEGDYRLSEPMGVDIAENGDVYVADTLDSLVKVFDKTGKFKFKFGGKDMFYLPADIAVGKDRVYIADTRNSRLQVFDLKGKFVNTLVGPEIGKKIGAWLPQAVYLAPHGDIYVTDVFYHRVIVFSAQGELKTHFGEPGAGPGQLMYPNGIVVNAKGEVYVADSNNGRIQLFDNTGKLLGGLSVQEQTLGLAMPRGLALDTEGLLYVAETFRHACRILDLKGTAVRESLVMGQRGVGPGEMNYPNDVALRGEVLCIADRANDRIQVYQVIK